MTRIPVRFWIGALGLAVSEALLFGRQPFVTQWFTPLAWTFYILLVDGLLERLQGHSPLTRCRWHFGWVALASIGIWCVFEAYNVRMHGWRYDGLPENMTVRLIGYAWAFATIGPGMFETRELMEVLFFRDRGPLPGGDPARVSRALAWTSISVGLVCLISPFLVSQDTARYLWAPVWAGFIFAVDPVNARRGRASIWVDALIGDNRRLWTLLLGGLVCGILWEFWNFWATTRWVYTFPPPIADLKLFEMPVVGFIGFPPFAVEYFVLTELVARLWGGNADLGAGKSASDREGPGRLAVTR